MRRVLLGSLSVLFLSGPCWADGTSFGVGAGLADPSDIGATPWFTANLRLEVAKNVAIETEGGYWKKTENFLNLLDVSFRDLNFGASAVYLFPSSGKVRFSAGAGLGVHLVKGAVGTLGFSESDTATRLGPQAFAGLDYKMGSASLFANVRYDLVSDFNQFKVYGGVRFGGK
jgi:hypothetical protein